LFDLYDKNKNKRLSAEELSSALSKDMKINLAEDEVKALKDYFRNRHGSTEIGELDFMSLLSMKFQRLFDEPEAKRALAIIKQRIYNAIGKTAKMICKEFDVEGIDRLSLRNFKHALHSLKVLTQYQIDNLTKFLDTEDDGFISVDRLDVELRNVYVGQSSTGGGNPLLHSSSGNNLNIGATMHSTTSGKRRNKWG
jgi:Ca2+-binding EF-hand superfamily protein